MISQSNWHLYKSGLQGLWENKTDALTLTRTQTMYNLQGIMLHDLCELNVHCQNYLKELQPPQCSMNLLWRTALVHFHLLLDSSLPYALKSCRQPRTLLPKKGSK